MAEVFSSPRTLGKRGGGVLSPHPHNHVGQIDFSSKKRRLVCGADLGLLDANPAAELHRSSSPIHSSKRARPTSPSSPGGGGGLDGREVPTYTHRQFETLAREKDAEIVAARKEMVAMRAHLGEKEGELLRVRDENSRLQGGVGVYQKEIERLHGENRILKRGVTIQNTKCKEVEGQLLALQHAALQAAEYIKRLEQTNYALSVRVQTMGSPGTNDFMGERPPDVF
ncbi:unnamed protein product [Discosporangium mesarthrocarpum]